MTSSPPGVDLSKPQEPEPWPGPPGAFVPQASHKQVRGARAWPAWMGLAAMLAGFGLTIVVGGAVMAVAAAAGASFTDPPPDVTIALTLVQNLALIGAAFGFAWLGGGRPSAQDFGLRRAGVWRSIGLILLVWALFFAFAVSWSSALGLENQKQDLPDQLGIDRSVLAALAVAFLVTVVAPLGEELFFRGFFFGSLRNWRGPWPAAIITGLVFGAIHFGSSPPAFVVPLAFFGVGLCLLYHYSGSLYPCIALHALNNSIALGAGMDWTWQIPAMMVGSVIVSLTIAWLIARFLGALAAPFATSAPAPGVPGAA